MLSANPLKPPSKRVSAQVSKPSTSAVGVLLASFTALLLFLFQVGGATVLETVMTPPARMVGVASDWASGPTRALGEPSPVDENADGLDGANLYGRANEREFGTAPSAIPFAASSASADVAAEALAAGATSNTTASTATNSQSSPSAANSAASQQVAPASSASSGSTTAAAAAQSASRTPVATIAPTTSATPRTTAAPSATAASAAPTTAAPRTTAAPATTAASTTAAATQTGSGRPALYVSPSGTDRSGGGRSEGNPLRSPDYAVSQASAGTTIYLLPGNYEPMTIDGRRDLVVVAPHGGVVFSSGRYDRDAGVLIEDSTNIVVEGVRVEFSLWGLRVNGSHGVVLRNNSVFNIGQEAIHVLNKSSDVLIEGNRIDLTGQRQGSSDGLPYWARGEGVYLGTGGLLPGGVEDTVSDIQVIGNHMTRISAEAVEIKASVEDVLVRGNIIHDVDLHSGAAVSIGRGTRIYDANVVVEYNVIFDIQSRESRRDGIGIRISSPATVRNNAIWDTEHYGIRIDEQLRNVNGSVSVQDNVIHNSGVSDVFNEAGGTGVPIRIGGTISGNAASQFIGNGDSQSLIARLQR